MKRAILFTIRLALLVSLITVSALAQNEAAAGQAAEQAGKFNEALTHYIAALQSTTEGREADQQMREKIIGLAQKLHPPPTLPEEAERHFARGKAAVKAAQKQADFQDAVAEFKAALRTAPWMPEAYYNLGVVQDKIGQYTDAIVNLKLYLLASPGAPDAKQVRDLMFEIEYRRDKAEKEATAKREEEDRHAAIAAEAERQRRDEERGIWIDRTTGLMWTYKNSDSDVTPNLATNICQNLSVGGYSGWRLPEISELEGIYASGQETIKTRLRGTGGIGYTWSATRNGSGEPWMFGFPETWRPTGRRVLNNLGHTFIYRTLCVRRSGE